MEHDFQDTIGEGSNEDYNRDVVELSEREMDVMKQFDEDLNAGHLGRNEPECYNVAPENRIEIKTEW